MGWGADTIGSHNPRRQAPDYRTVYRAASYTYATDWDWIIFTTDLGRNILNSTYIMPQASPVIFFILWRYNLDHYLRLHLQLVCTPKSGLFHPLKSVRHDLELTGLDAANCMVLFLRQGLFRVYTTKRQYPKIQKKYSQKRNCTDGLSPNFHIHASVSDLYIPTMCLPILLQENMWTDPGNI